MGTITESIGQPPDTLDLNMPIFAPFKFLPLNSMVANVSETQEHQEL